MPSRLLHGTGDVVGILPLVFPLGGVIIHLEEGGDGAGRKLDPVHAACGQAPADHHHLVEARRQVGAVRPVQGEVADQRRHVLFRPTPF